MSVWLLRGCAWDAPSGGCHGVMSGSVGPSLKDFEKNFLFWERAVRKVRTGIETLPVGRQRVLELGCVATLYGRAALSSDR